MKKTIFIFYVLMQLSVLGFSQKKTGRFSLWKLASLSGETKIKGQYRQYKISSYNISELQKSSYLSGGVLLNTKSFILHPNFLTLDVDAGYNPETSRNNYIVFPDQSEVTTLKKLNIRTNLLPQKKVTLFTFANFDDSFQNRESLTDIKSNSKQWGGALFYTNKFLPVSTSFRKGQRRQREITTGRNVNVDERVFECGASKSFFSRDKNELNYSHNESVTHDIFSDYDFKVVNIIDDIHLNNIIPFDEKRKYLLNSMISNFNQHGNKVFTKFQASENITIKLSQNYTLSSNYYFNRSQQELNKLTNHGFQSSLARKFYLSLDSRLFFEYNRINHTLYKENSGKAGFDVFYIKKIPAKGKLSLSYTFFRGHQSMDSNPSKMQILREEYLLSDGQMVLIRNPYVDKESVVISNSTGTITFQINIDYLLIERYPYLEIVRIPGGLITNNEKVYVDYNATQSGSFKYDTDNHSFSADVLLFERKFNVYYRISTQDYKNMTQTEFQALNYFTRTSVGGRLDFGFINGGAEYNDYNSVLIPYRMTRYFLGIQKNYRAKILLTLNGNIQEYYLVNEKINQKYSDLTGKIAYSAFGQTKINFDLMYRNQSGRGIELDLITAKSEITSLIRQLYLIAGVELYRRNYTGSKINFKGIYIQIIRRF